MSLPEDIRNRLAGLEHDFGATVSSTKWVAPSLLHITVRFLGNILEDRVLEVQEATARAAQNSPRFTLALAGLGAFPSERAPRVVWVGLREDGGMETLRRVYRGLASELQASGFEPEDRRFAPHITLARARDGISNDDRRQLGETLMRVRQRTRIEGSFDVNALVVMRSDPGSGGPRYTAIETFHLEQEP